MQCRRLWFNPWVGKIPRQRKRLPSPVFWPGEFHGLYSPWGHKESDMTERLSLSLSGGSSGKQSACQYRRHKRCRIDPWVGKIPWRREWLSTLVFWPGIPWTSPWGCKELDTTERLSLFLFILSVQFSRSVVSNSL